MAERVGLSSRYKDSNILAQGLRNLPISIPPTIQSTIQDLKGLVLASPRQPDGRSQNTNRSAKFGAVGRVHSCQCGNKFRFAFCRFRVCLVSAGHPGCRIAFSGRQSFCSKYVVTMSANAWSDLENDAIVARYFAMLSDELSARRYNKAAINRLLQDQTGRNRGSVEFKLRNVSAVVQGFGLPSLKVTSLSSIFRCPG